MIQLNRFTYRYPNTDKPALDDVNLTIPKGDFVGIVGANGAGKTSLCYALSGFIPHFFKGKWSGEVHVAGFNVVETPLGSVMSKVGLVFQNPFNQITGARYTVREEIAFGLENLGIPRHVMIPRVEKVLNQMGLENLAERSPFELSGGQQQRLAIASVIVMQPEVLILDEPTSQLDPMGTIEVFSSLQDLIAEENTTIVLATHKVEWLAVFAKKVAILEKGNLIDINSPQKVLTRPDLSTLGISATRYTQAADLARQRGIGDMSAQLPVTLDQAVEYFRGH